ncbi:hypothetical protein AB1Y20_013395 [Prymnesium parvum]|uniref:Protein xylosyltransferase n=1 Tax=Prymnesium parvum TaxID=97485 RepID=A0AB34IHP1_PRYPA
MASFSWGARRTGASSTSAWLDGTFDRTLFARCAPHEPPLARLKAPTASRCESLCRGAPRCAAAEFLSSASSCDLYASCLERRAVPQRAGAARLPPTHAPMVLHAWGPSLPQSPAAVRWEANAALVVASFDGLLPWMRHIPAGALDIAFYQKVDYGVAANESKARSASERRTRRGVLQQLCPAGVLLPREAPPLPRGLTREDLGECAPPGGARLAYWTVLPNYGRTAGGGQLVRGGSREPFVFLQFILDFWSNMPPVVIFTQDDCAKMTACIWLKKPHLYEALKDWRTHWGAAVPFSSKNCFCRIIKESFYGPGSRYYWYRYMSFLQEQLFNVTSATRPPGINWPIDATFVVGRANILQQPYWLYEVLHRVTVVEDQCLRSGSIMWAHSYERLWFEILDGQVPKVARMVENDPSAVLSLAGECLYGTPDKLEEYRRRMRRL